MASNYSPIVLSGPSGAGKTELIEYLKKVDPIFEEAPGITTRPRRVGETSSNTFFVTFDEFFDAIEKGQLIQYATYNGNYYGTLKSAFDLLDEKQVLFNMGLGGAKAVKNLRPDSSLIYILPPNKEELIRRMGDRDRNRIEIGIKQTMNSIDLYDYLLISHTGEFERLYLDFMSIFLQDDDCMDKSLQLTKNKNFMKRFYH